MSITLDADLLQRALTDSVRSSFRGAVRISPQDLYLRGLANGIATGLADADVGSVTGVVPIANGGTGQTTAPLALAALGGVSLSGSYADPSWLASLSASKLTGAIAAANGGTGQSSYTVGDLLYASGAAALSKLADVATGNALISGGIGAAPSWGKIGLATHVSGTLADGSLSSNVPLLAASNVFTGVVNTFQRTALGAALAPAPGLNLQNATAATAGSTVQNAPAVLLEARIWGQGVPADAMADRPFAVALAHLPSNANGGVTNAVLMTQRDGGGWVAMWKFGGTDPYGGVQDSICYGELEVRGPVTTRYQTQGFAMNDAAFTYPPRRVLVGDGSDNIELKTLGSGKKLSVKDSAGALAPLVAKSIEATPLTPDWPRAMMFGMGN